jgi:hypothetical protein
MKKNSRNAKTLRILYFIFHCVLSPILNHGAGEILDKPVQYDFKSDIIPAMSTKVELTLNQAAASATSAARAWGCPLNL